eukprot:28892-Eustigmatos_ZCMA.PRE.1
MANTLDPEARQTRIRDHPIINGAPVVKRLGRPPRGTILEPGGLRRATGSADRNGTSYNTHHICP